MNSVCFTPRCSPRSGPQLLLQVYCSDAWFCFCDLVQAVTSLWGHFVLPVLNTVCSRLVPMITPASVIFRFNNCLTNFPYLKTLIISLVFCSLFSFFIDLFQKLLLVLFSFIFLFPISLVLLFCLLWV